MTFVPPQVLAPALALCIGISVAWLADNTVTTGRLSAPRRAATALAMTVIAYALLLPRLDGSYSSWALAALILVIGIIGGATMTDLRERTLDGLHVVLAIPIVLVLGALDNISRGLPPLSPLLGLLTAAAFSVAMWLGGWLMARLMHSPPDDLDQAPATNGWRPTVPLLCLAAALALVDPLVGLVVAALVIALLGATRLVGRLLRRRHEAAAGTEAAPPAEGWGTGDLLVWLLLGALLREPLLVLSAFVMSVFINGLLAIPVVIADRLRHRSAGASFQPHVPGIALAVVLLLLAARP